MAEGAWVQSDGKVWDESQQAWENAWGEVADIILYDNGSYVIEPQSVVVRGDSAGNLPVMTTYPTYLQVNCPVRYTGGAFYIGLVNITPFTKLYANIDATFSLTGSGIGSYVIWADDVYSYSTPGWAYYKYKNIVHYNSSTSIQVTAELDVSNLTGQMYVGIGADASQSTSSGSSQQAIVKCNKIWLCV